MPLPFMHAGGLWEGLGRAEPMAAAPSYPNPYADLPQNPDAVRARELQELDIMGDLPNATFQPYVGRLQKLSDLLDTHITGNVPGGYEVRKRLLEEAPNLAMHETNFNADPYSWFDPATKLESLTPRTKLPTFDPDYVPARMEAVVQGGNQWHNKALINPNSRYTMTDALLAHEAGAHIPQVKNPADDWKANFSPSFMRGLAMLGERKTSPFYEKGSWSGRSFETDPYEVMGYLMGREAELPKGKTLKDDPTMGYLFQREPGAYEEYARARDVHRKRFGKRK